MGLGALAVLGMIELAGIQLPGRMGTVTTAQIVGRAIAPINPQLAKELTPTDHAGSTNWRQLWWGAIWRSVHATPTLTAFGHGYGFNLLGLMPKDARGTEASLDTRTPHSVFYFALGYTGWVGVVLFGIFQFTILRLLWRTYRATGEPIGIVLWLMGMTAACFDPSFDTPYKAIPFYLLAGMAMAPGLQARREPYARFARAQLLPAAGR
jgi:O-antigen ligase